MFPVLFFSSWNASVCPLFCPLACGYRIKLNILGHIWKIVWFWVLTGKVDIVVGIFKPSFMSDAPAVWSSRWVCFTFWLIDWLIQKTLRWRRELVLDLCSTSTQSRQLLAGQRRQEMESNVCVVSWREVAGTDTQTGGDSSNPHVLRLPPDVWLVSLFSVNTAETNPLIDFDFPPTDLKWKSMFLVFTSGSECPPGRWQRLMTSKARNTSGSG